MEKFSMENLKEQFRAEGLGKIIPGGDKKIDEILLTFRIAMAESDGLRKLAESPGGPAALKNCLRKAIKSGLSLSPHEGMAAITPMARKGGGAGAVFQIMKNGYIRLAIASGSAKVVRAEVVRENDEFNLSIDGASDRVQFSPAKKSRGEVVGFAAWLVTRDGAVHGKYLAIEESIEWQRDYSKHSQLNSVEYGKKTVVKQLLRDVSLPNLPGGIDILKITAQSDEIEPDEIGVEAVSEKIEQKKPEKIGAEGEGLAIF